MKFMDTVVINDDFYNNTEGLVINKRIVIGEIQYLVSITSYTDMYPEEKIERWFAESFLTVKPVQIFIPKGSEDL